MAVIKTTNPKVSTLKQGIKYITNPEKAELITGKDCTAETALEEMQTTKALYNKTEGRQYMHFVQSFKPDDPLDPSKAHQIGLEMAEKRFKGYEVLVATHTDKDHLHNHLIVNSVSFETGAKFQHSKNDLKAIKEISDQLCERALEPIGTNTRENARKREERNESDQEIRGEREVTEFRNQETCTNKHGSERENGKTGKSKLSKAGEGFRDHQRGSEKDPRKQQQNNPRGHESSAPGQNHSKPELEGTGEAIRNTTSDNSRTSDHNLRSVPTGDSLNDAIKALGSSFEKVQQEKKLKAQLIKEKLEMIASQKEQKSELMKEKLEMIASQKTRSKGRDWGPDL